MSFDINEIHITGAIERRDAYDTKTGKPMMRLIVRCWKESMAVIVFDDLARQAKHFIVGDRAEVFGFIQSTVYTGKDGVKRYGYQVVAKELRRDAGQADRTSASPGGDSPAHPEPVTAPPLATDRLGRPPILNDQFSPF